NSGFEVRDRADALLIQGPLRLRGDGKRNAIDAVADARCRHDAFFERRAGFVLGKGAVRAHERSQRTRCNQRETVLACNPHLAPSLMDPGLFGSGVERPVETLAPRENIYSRLND